MSLQFQYLYQFRNGKGYTGISGCTSQKGCSLYFHGSSLLFGGNNGSSGGGARNIQLVTGGDACPQDGTDILPNDKELTLFLWKEMQSFMHAKMGSLLDDVFFGAGQHRGQMR